MRTSSSSTIARRSRAAPRACAARCRRRRRGRRARAGSGRPGGGRRRPPRTGWRAGCRRSTRSCRAPRRPRRRARRPGWAASSQATCSAARAVLSPRCGRPSGGCALVARCAASRRSPPGPRRTLCPRSETSRRVTRGAAAPAGGRSGDARRSSPTRAAHRLRRGSWKSSSGEQPLPGAEVVAPAGRVDPRPQRLGVVGGHDRLAQPARRGARARARSPGASEPGSSGPAVRLGRLAHARRRAAAPCDAPHVGLDVAGQPVALRCRSTGRCSLRSRETSTRTLLGLPPSPCSSAHSASALRPCGLARQQGEDLGQPRAQLGAPAVDLEHRALVAEQR